MEKIRLITNIGVIMQKRFLMREFNKEKLYIYLFLNFMVAGLLIANSFLGSNREFWIYILCVLLLLVFIICLYLLIEFIILIPTTDARLINICLGSSLLLSLILLTYSNLYYLIYLIKGKKAFSFSGDHLSGNDFLYYSITTFTTTGYGDITSIGIFSNSIAASEMLIGMISNTILMAIITSKLIKNLT
ncbi:ion channel [Metabacillus herbersteinensis]|uniref:Ion channel n=1 Tax=Metabacillus herbersteinensis TaxID=283816 RepID=A0ABV6GCK2_9BACI